MSTNAIDANYKPAYYAQAQNIVSSSGNEEESASIYETANTGEPIPTDMDYACTDGKNDGRLSTGEAIESVGKGILKSAVNMVKMPFTEAAKGNFLPALAVVAGAALCATPLGAPLAVIGGAIGIAKGVGDIVGGLAKADEIANSGNGTDGEAKAALEGVGSGILTTGLSAVAVAGGVKTMKARGGAMSKLEKGAKFGDKVKAFKEDTITAGKDTFGKLTSKVKAPAAETPATDAPDAQPTTDTPDAPTENTGANSGTGKGEQGIKPQTQNGKDVAKTADTDTTKVQNNNTQQGQPKGQGNNNTQQGQNTGSSTPYDRQIQEAQNSLSTLETKIKHYKTQIETAQSQGTDTSILEGKLKQAQIDLSKTNSQIKNLTSKAETYSTKVSEYGTQVDDAMANLESSTKQLKASQKQLEAMQKQGSHYSDHAIELQKQITDINSQQAAASRNQLVQAQTKVDNYIAKQRSAAGWTVDEPTTIQTSTSTAAASNAGTAAVKVKVYGKQVDISGTTELATETTRSLKRWDRNHGTDFLQQYIKNYTNVNGTAPKKL